VKYPPLIVSTDPSKWKAQEQPHLLAERLARNERADGREAHVAPIGGSAPAPVRPIGAAVQWRGSLGGGISRFAFVPAYLLSAKELGPCPVAEDAAEYVGGQSAERSYGSGRYFIEPGDEAREIDSPMSKLTQNNIGLYVV
jgi:hypothetical protein